MTVAPASVTAGTELSITIKDGDGSDKALIRIYGRDTAGRTVACSPMTLSVVDGRASLSVTLPDEAQFFRSFEIYSSITTTTRNRVVTVRKPRANRATAEAKSRMASVCRSFSANARRANSKSR
jgi:hypothetical protein